MRILSTSLLALVTAVGAASADGYKLTKTIPVPGDGGWDYCSVDAAGRRVYVSHGNQVDVIDADANKVAGTISDLKGVHGIAVASDLGRGFISNGRGNNVTVFDLKTLKTIGDPVATGKNPDAILYDPSSKRVFAFNGRDGSATVIDAAEGKVLGTIDLGGKPEFAAADGAGDVFANLEDKSTIVKIDAAEDDRLERWPLDARRGAVGHGDRREEPSALRRLPQQDDGGRQHGDRQGRRPPADRRARGRRRVRPGDGPGLLLLRRRHGDGRPRGRAGQVQRGGDGQDQAAVEDDGAGPEDARPLPAVGGLPGAAAAGRRCPGTFAVLRFSKG